ncbi:MAG: hypothetical protein NT023_10810 [Armatimonadetes bacterium]|nr:hypothetical protein [Armatimonadota bacterium]
MDKVIIAEVGLEGGGLKLCGCQSNGVWLFWQEGTSMDMDENDDEVWRSWATDPVPALALALPEKWCEMYPIRVHKDFVAPLHHEYVRCQDTQNSDAMERHRHESWLKVFAAQR